jgi:alanine-glyoxylate transaminase/serine-glyoxylate transaminase/serine-pyruvate transaminase
MTTGALSLEPPQRVLMGPGPSDVHPRVTRALTAPLLGHLDPAFLRIMDDTVRLLRAVFQTNNRLTFPVSGTGSAGMEAAVCNIVEPGDTVVVGVNGFFGGRIAEVASRYGANVVVVEGEWGKALDPGKMAAAVRSQPKVKAVALVQGETSTGLLQPLEDICRTAREAGALTIVDAVTSLGGVDLPLDNGVSTSAIAARKNASVPRRGWRPFLSVSGRGMPSRPARVRSPVGTWTQPSWTNTGGRSVCTTIPHPLP